ncbi:MAG: hypothetical protein KKD74_00875 [Bacteroidetes bacterium]|nr:hypothetical protein [Bacteroidota bacterium]
MMKWVFFLLLLMAFGHPSLMAQTHGLESNSFRWHGYVKGMPSVTYTSATSEFYFDQLLHNRMNFRWQPSPKFNMVFETRTRLFSGATPENNALFVGMMDKDAGFLDLTKSWKVGKYGALQLMSDRFYAEWTHNDWQIRLGRQRINWGINLVSNPNDLFNTYSYFDIDYEERPGADALRVQRYFGGMSHIEVAMMPASHVRHAVAALLYGFNANGYDIQVLAGYFRNRLALGGGWAGHIGGAGFKGEMTWFTDFQPVESLQASNAVAAISVDYLFSNGLYLAGELLYNGGNDRKPASFISLSEPFSADNLSIGKYALTASLMYPFSPIFSANFASMYIPDQHLVYVMPGISWSMATNWDLGLVSQVFVVGNKSALGSSAYAAYLSLKWSF